MGMGRGEPPKVLQRGENACQPTSPLRVFGSMWFSGVSKVNESKDFQTSASIFIYFFFVCVPSKMTAVLLLFITISIRLMSQSVFVLSLRRRWRRKKNQINNASDVSTYGCLCGGATSFSKTSVVKKPRGEDWEREREGGGWWKDIFQIQHKFSKLV